MGRSTVRNFALEQTNGYKCKPSPNISIYVDADFTKAAFVLFTGGTSK